MRPASVDGVGVSLGGVLVAIFAAGLNGGGVAAAQTQGGAPPISMAAPEVKDGKGAIDLERMGGADRLEVLSDTQGVNFQPYLRKMLSSIYDQWLRLIPAEARPPQKLAGETVIRFAILPDGTLESMHLDGSTHDDKLNRAAWGAIASVGKYPALPAAFHGPHLELRVRFKVNE